MKKQLKDLLLPVCSVVLFSFLSPKWLFWPAAFLAPAFLLYFVRSKKPLATCLWTFAILFISNLIANYGVMPFPDFVFIIVGLQVSLIQSVPYIAHHIFVSRINGNGWTTHLIFPLVAVIVEYVSSLMGGGTWGSVAYSQMNNFELIQLASITGIWGISFLIYWFASLSVWLISAGMSVMRYSILIYAAVIVIVLFYGSARTNPFFNKPPRTMKVAAITGLNVGPFATIYHDAFGKSIAFNATTLDHRSPELAELNKGLAKFIESPFDPKFKESHRALKSFQDSLFTLAARQAKAGAKVIAFSEALMFTFKPVEKDLLKRGVDFAKEHNVSLLLSLASFFPGKIEFGSKYLENKAILISSRGEVVYTFLKNKPVPLVEGSVPGNGEIPVAEEENVRLAVSICYDADFPALMRKAGVLNADILLLPSGDWKEVATYHASMARMRAIENGFSILRPVSGGTSLACDQYGKVLGLRDFYANGEKVLMVDIPVQGMPTFYKIAGDYFPIFCVISILILIARPWWKTFGDFFTDKFKPNWRQRNLAAARKR